MSDSGVPYLADVQRSRLRWRFGAAVAVVLGFVAVIVLIVVIVRLAGALDARRSAITYIEDTNDQQLCVDEIEAEWQESISNVVLAALAPDDSAEGDASRFADDVRRALDKLERIDELCPRPARPDTDVAQAKLLSQYVLSTFTDQEEPNR